MTVLGWVPMRRRRNPFLFFFKPSIAHAPESFYPFGLKKNSLMGHPIVHERMHSFSIVSDFVVYEYSYVPREDRGISCIPSIRKRKTLIIKQHFHQLCRIIAVTIGTLSARTTSCYFPPCIPRIKRKPTHHIQINPNLLLSQRNRFPFFSFGSLAKIQPTKYITKSKIQISHRNSKKHNLLFRSNRNRDFAKMNFICACLLLIASIASMHGTFGLQLSMVASRAPFKNSRTKSLEQKIPFTTTAKKTSSSSSSSSVTSTLISNLACMALKRRLIDQTHVSCDLAVDTNNLFFGRVGPVTVKGRGWKSPLGLTCRAIEATVNECSLDMGRVISNQKLVLTTPGTRVVKCVDVSW